VIEAKAQSIQGKLIAMLATDGFEQMELTEPKKTFEAAGARVEVIAPENTREKGSIRGWNVKDWGDSVHVDRQVADADPQRYDALVLPGGVMNPDKLRMDEKAVAFVKAFGETGKPIAAICHGPWTLINSGLARGHTMTSYPSVRKDLENAGVSWKNEEVVVDGKFITSRKPDDIPAFSQAVIAALAEPATA
jgi:protease I